MHKGTFVKIAINKYDFFIFSERKQKNNILDGMCWLKVEPLIKGKLPTSTF